MVIKFVTKKKKKKNMFKHIHVHTYFERVQLNKKTCTLQIHDMIHKDKVSFGETN